MSEPMKKPDRGGSQAISKSLAKPDTTTQAGQVLEALERQPMSAAELQWGLRIAHAPAAVRDLRKKGYSIVTEWHPHPSRPGKRVKRYRLLESK